MSQFIDQIVEEVVGWQGVERTPHRFGGIEFQLDKREIGHVHRGSGLVDIPFSAELHDLLLQNGLANRHHVLPDSNWITFPVRTEADRAHAIWLFRLAYLRHYMLLSRHPKRAANLPVLEVRSALEQLALPEPFQRVFEGMLTA